MSNHQLNRNDWLWAAGFFALALLVRLVFLFTSPDCAWPHSFFYEGDAPRWLEWAQSLQAGEPFLADLPLHPPAVAFLLYWLAPISFGEPMLFMKSLWCIVSASGCALAYLAVARTVNRRIAVIVGFMMTFSFGSYVLATSLNNEVLYIPVLMAIVLMTSMNRKLTVGWAAALGALHGIAMLIRPEHMLLLAMMLVYMAWQYGLVQRLWLSLKRTGSESTNEPIGRVAVVFGTLLLASMLVCAPWNVRSSIALQEMNYTLDEPLDFDAYAVAWTDDARDLVDLLPAFTRHGTVETMSRIAEQLNVDVITSEDVLNYFVTVWNYIPEPLPNWSFVSIKGGSDFAVANHPAARDGYVEDIVQLAEGVEATTGIDRPDHLYIINHGYRLGWDYITDDFGDWLSRVGAKLSRFHEGNSYGFTSRNLPLGWEGQRRAVDMFTASGSDGTFRQFFYGAWRLLILVLIVCGLWLAATRRTAGVWLLVIAYKVIVTIFFYGYARQSASISPAFFVLMAITLDHAALRAAPWFSSCQRWMKPAAIAALTGVVILDAGLAWKRPALIVDGEGLTAMPEFGDDAFTSPKRITIEPAATR